MEEPHDQVNPHRHLGKRIMLGVTLVRPVLKPPVNALVEVEPDSTNVPS
jgi:hypothetical protein